VMSWKGQTTVQVINKTTGVKNKIQKSSSGIENVIGERGGRSPLATASRRVKGTSGKTGVEGERFKDNFSDGRDVWNNTGKAT
jgi:hypothetical protein